MRFRRRKPEPRYPSITFKPNAEFDARVTVKTCQHGNLLGPMVFDPEREGTFIIRGCTIITSPVTACDCPGQPSTTFPYLQENQQ